MTAIVLDPFKTLALDGDLATRQAAGRAGWRIDGDGWFWRDARPLDPDFPDRLNALGFKCDGRVYVASCDDALRYDAGAVLLEGVQA